MLSTGFIESLDATVLFGAEFTRAYAQERGRGIPPAKHAVRVNRKEIELAPLTDRARSQSDEQ